jgi:hypothetical protein
MRPKRKLERPKLMFGLSTIAWKAIGVLVVLLTLMACGAKLMSIWDTGKITKLQGVIATGHAQVAQVAAVTKTLTVQDQAAEATAQEGLGGQRAVITKEITHYVSVIPSPPVGCVTWGMLRLHDAAVLGVDPGGLGDPAAQPNDACSTVAPSVFMAAVTDNYGAARANAEQLDRLIGDVEARTAAIAAATAEGSPPPLKLPSLPHL